MSKQDFENLIGTITSAIVGKKLDVFLANELNSLFSPESIIIKDIKNACEEAISEGWMCDKEHGGIKFGRVCKDIDGFSVDVVHMNNVVGPHHRHPNGEIDLVLPLNGDAKFDNYGAGWVVYEPGSAHNPTVTDGTALVLYLLPGGKIEFTGN